MSRSLWLGFWKELVWSWCYVHVAPFLSRQGASWRQEPCGELLFLQSTQRMQVIHTEVGPSYYLPCLAARPFLQKLRAVWKVLSVSCLLNQETVPWGQAEGRTRNMLVLCCWCLHGVWPPRTHMCKSDPQYVSIKRWRDFKRGTYCRGVGLCRCCLGGD